MVTLSRGRVYRRLNHSGVARSLGESIFLWGRDRDGGEGFSFLRVLFLLHKKQVHMTR